MKHDAKNRRPKNLWAAVQPALQNYARQPAWICRIRDGRRVVQYRELHDAALTIADNLRARGIGGGDSIGIIAPNGPEFSAAALAAWKIGAAIAPIHIANSDEDIAAQIAALSPQVILVHDADIAADIKIEGARDRLMTIDMAVESEAVAREIKRAHLDDGGDDGEHDDGRVAARIYTSGSTAAAKVVRLSHANLISNVLAAAQIETFDSRDRFISLLPFSHAMGLVGTLLLPLRHGAAIVSPRVLAAAEILETLQDENISVVIAVPRLYRNVMLGLEKKFAAGGRSAAVYRAILKCAPLALRRRINFPIRKKLGGRITAWVSGGSHLDARISRYYHALGLPLRQGYGLTETSPLTCMQDAFDAAPESVGKAVAEVEIKIDKPDANGGGEVLIKGANVMLGYEDRRQTNAAMNGDWFKSGDIGRIDVNGRLFLIGRSKRLIVSDAGKNIHPEELETLLERDGRVVEAGVFELEMRAACVLAMDADNAPQVREVIAAFNRRVSAHNRIARFAVVDNLPRTPLGKIALRELPAVFARHEIKPGN